MDENDRNKRRSNVKQIYRYLILVPFVNIHDSRRACIIIGGFRTLVSSINYQARMKADRRGRRRAFLVPVYAAAAAGRREGEEWRGATVVRYSWRWGSY